MKLTRRALLSMLALAVADPERLIWQPGKKLISIPAAPKPTFLRLNFPNRRHSIEVVEIHSLEVLDQYGRLISVHLYPPRDQLFTQQPLVRQKIMAIERSIGGQIRLLIGPSPAFPPVPPGLRLWPGESRRSSSATGRA